MGVKHAEGKSVESTNSFTTCTAPHSNIDYGGLKVLPHPVLACYLPRRISCGNDPNLAWLPQPENSRVTSPRSRRELARQRLFPEKERLGLSGSEEAWLWISWVAWVAWLRRRVPRCPGTKYLEIHGTKRTLVLGARGLLFWVSCSVVE